VLPNRRAAGKPARFVDSHEGTSLIAPRLRAGACKPVPTKQSGRLCALARRRQRAGLLGVLHARRGGAPGLMQVGMRPRPRAVLRKQVAM
jgi:hypothetical protein